MSSLLVGQALNEGTGALLTLPPFEPAYQFVTLTFSHSVAAQG